MEKTSMIKTLFTHGRAVGPTLIANLIEAFDQKVNKLLAEGWEFVSLTSTTRGEYIYLFVVLKREVAHETT